MSEPLQKRINRTLAQAEGDLHRLSNQIEESQEKNRQAERKIRDATGQLEVLHKEYTQEEKQIAEYRGQIEALQRQIEDVNSRMKVQENRHEGTRKKLKEIRKQSRAEEHNRRAAGNRQEKLTEKKNKHNAKLQFQLEQLLEEHLQACWIELNNCKSATPGMQALTRLHADMEQNEEIATRLEELDYWEQNNPPQPSERIRQKRLAELRRWIEQHYPGALAARSRQKQDAIPSMEELFYQRRDSTYILPMPVPTDVWNGLYDGIASQEHDIAIQLLWAILERLPASAEVKINASDMVPILRCNIQDSSTFPSDISVPMTMDFLLSTIPPRLENSRLFK